jgi:hypothetical protein
MIHAPGIVRWAINGAKFRNDRDAMVKTISEGWNIPRDAARKLVLGQVGYAVDGETVVFTA